MKEQIQSFTADFLERHSLSALSFSVEEESASHLARYFHADNRIELFYNQFVSSYLINSTRYSFEDYLTLILCHEIGHSLDPSFKAIYDSSIELTNELAKLVSIFESAPAIETLEQILDKFTEYRDLTFLAEHNAWKEGYSVVPPSLRESYDVFNQENLDAYEKHFQLALDKFELAKRNIF